MRHRQARKAERDPEQGKRKAEFRKKLTKGPNCGIIFI